MQPVYIPYFSTLNAAEEAPTVKGFIEKINRKNCTGGDL